MMTLNSPPSSPTPSHSTSTRHIQLRLPDVASLIVKLRRHSQRAQDRAREYPIQSSSGEPQTHPTLSGDDQTSARKIPLVEERRFLCKGGVDVKKLLRTMRASLLEEAQSIGAHVLVDEQWTSSIHSPRRDGVYKVDIRYVAYATRSHIPDPQQPVALDQAQGVSGLMTVLA
ncbi:hypothetical protein BDY19DRAFT_955217 [Irpex rosettiformis]|uniref:Uncharacterized protein n=1 Tax=Irpex rosettiformis TaxID=378272 RepID=A0ACB8U006_9APHY|nr:hypothetical protein BDY19DRAFT_955217 [Irpex rosettiformis]